ncbi:MAG TPA: PfkB family carbohydrate kinase [Trueperaceae bacterium]|nr:PfkB family carbohydrate kinase [Trueperaceae bacterium]
MAERRNVDIICLGEALIDLVAEGHGVPLSNAERFLRAAGGAPANVAVGAARLGASVGFVGKVGADPFGDHLVDTLAGAGVDTSHTLQDPEHLTGLAFVSLLMGGEREFLFYRNPSADQRLEASELDEGYIASARLLHIGTLTLAVEPAREATLHAVSVAGAAGVLRSLDVNLRPAAWPTAEAARASALAAIAAAEIVKVSEDELEFLTGGTGRKSAAKLLHDALELLVVTLGRAGVSYYLRGASKVVSGTVPGFEVAAVDATGAGDAFVAGMLTGLLEAPAALKDPLALEPVLRRANACGAIATTRLGAIPALPDGLEVDAFMSVRGG